MDCPICMDAIVGAINCVTTECGHCFHTNCLMTSVAHNGFGCPYCRTAMAQEPREDEDEDEEQDQWSDIEDEEDNEYALRGFRFFFNNVQGEQHAEEDEQDEENNQDDDSDEEEDEVIKPSVDIVTRKLVEQGITMEQLVKAILGASHEEYQQSEEFERADDELFGKMRVIISNFTPEEV